MATIYSTATCDNTFTFYKEKKEGEEKTKSTKVSANVISKAITIKGALNQEIKSKRGKYGETEVTAEDLKLLKSHKQYIKGVDAGFFSEKAPISPKKDKSAQLTEKKVKETTKADVTTGKAEV